MNLIFPPDNLKTIFHQLRESLRTYAQEDADEFVRPTTVVDVLAEGLCALGDGEVPVSAFADAQFDINEISTGVFRLVILEICGII